MSTSPAQSSVSKHPSAPAAPGQQPQKGLDAFLTHFGPVVHIAFILFCFGWFRIYFSDNPIAAVDLPGHITAIEGLRRNLWTLTYTFYDISCFTGYAAFTFYAFIGHMLTAIVSIPLTPFVDDPVRLACHLMLIAWQATLPISVTWALKPIAEELLDDDKVLYRQWKWILALSSSVFSFWFINHDSQWYGIGAAAVMNIGLFSQAFGWHFMALHFGALVRLIRSENDDDAYRVGLFYALGFLTHTMTMIFSFYLAFMSFLWFRHKRWAIFKSHVMAFFLSAFWLVPMVSYMSSYTGLDIHRPQGDFLEIMLRYPLFGLVRSMRTWLEGKFLLINGTEPLFVFLLAMVPFLRQTQKAKTFIAFFVFEILGLVILTNGFIASSFPLGFHYYRFVAYLLLFITILLAPVPLAVLKTLKNIGVKGRGMLIAQGITAGILVGCLVTTALLPHNERERVARTKDPSYLKNEFAVLEWFKNQPQKGRVLFEYFSNYDKFPFLSCHFMTTRLLKETGFESINGLFVQSSLAYHFPMGSANQLKANSYNGPLLYPAVTDLSDDAKVEQLIDFGITHVVLYQEEFYSRLKKFQASEPVQIGPYKIVTLQQNPPPKAATARKHIAVYSDVRGTASYKFMELYFYAKEKLGRNWELLSVKPGGDVPKETELIVVSGRPGAAADAVEDIKEALAKVGGTRDPRVITFNYRQEYLTKHYGTWYQHNPEIDDFTDFGKWLDSNNIFRDLMNSPPTPSTEIASAELQWSRDYQSFDLTGLQPGKLYRINYSHFPYWHSGDGDIWRGTGDRIFFRPEKDTAHFGYTRWLSFNTYVGWLMSILGVLWVYRGRKTLLAE